MTIQDPIANLFSSINNAQSRAKESVVVPSSTKKVALVEILKKEGYLKKEVFTAIQSIPAFEYWFLLHFTASTKPYSPLPTKSVGDQVIDDLKIYLPDYEKKQEGIYKYFIENGLIDGAKAHSNRIFENSKNTGNINPSTNVHNLVEYLEALKDITKKST